MKTDNALIDRAVELSKELKMPNNIEADDRITYSNQVCPVLNRWQPPSLGSYKMNVDGII